MLRKQVFLVLAIVAFIAVSFAHLDSIQIIQAPVAPQRQSTSAACGKAFGDGLQRGIEQGMAEAAARKREEERFQREQKAREDARAAEDVALRKQMAARYAEQQEQNKILREILQGYHPSKNTEYVLKVLESALPIDVKKCVVEIINGQAKAYTEALAKPAEK